jgi:hypothetical protein
MFVIMLIFDSMIFKHNRALWGAVEIARGAVKAIVTATESGCVAAPTALLLL